MKALIAVMVLTGGCARAPVTNRRTLTLVPEGEMAAMGQNAYREVLATSKVSSRADWDAMVRRVGSRIAAASGSDTAWEFNVLDAPDTVNAFALPGGKIAVYSGLFPVARTEAALAAVLGHEVAHVTAQHATERVSQTMLVQLGLTAAELSLDDPEQKGTLLGLLGLGAQLGVLLPYSRLHESEADEIGLIYMAKAGYDPRSAGPLWDRMGAAGGAAPPEFLSTHPSSEARAERLRGLANDALDEFAGSDAQPEKAIPQ